ncbi:TIGR02328 family protein [Listeria sp. PSOL-1]|uniref:TIGR02328 family protein n=1 Tax=Listeria sp. PSOL-1 TaxID=1844999 RepID=UPI0013D8DB03|nr:TIGR02328 family protein [Listeria sp. PSOL-1]
MRLWHEQLIPLLPRQQLLGQHRECCALRGNGWGKSHSTVNYIFTHPPYRLFQYHKKVMDEMTKRGYAVTSLWYNPYYRGKNCPSYLPTDLLLLKETSPTYPEHDSAYFKACLENLRQKGIHIATKIT